MSSTELPRDKINSLRDRMDAQGAKTVAKDAGLGRATLYRVLETGEAGPKAARGIEKALGNSKNKTN